MLHSFFFPIVFPFFPFFAGGGGVGSWVIKNANGLNFKKNKHY